MEIRTEDLRQIADRLFAHLEDTGHGVIELEKDFYWHIPTSHLYDRYDSPAEELDIGQLSEDWERLRSIVTGEMPPVVSGVAWLAAILRAIADSVTG